MFAAIGTTILAFTLMTVPVSATARFPQSGRSSQGANPTIPLPPGGTVRTMAPDASCSSGWQVAASAYLLVPGSNVDYGVVDLNYCAATRYVYGSVESYTQNACNTGLDLDCAWVWVMTGQNLTAHCYVANGQYGCNTSQTTDQNVTSYAEGWMFINLSGTQATGETASY